MSMRIECLDGEAIAAHLESLAALRIEVFREYPYLYEGSRKYERGYLETLLGCPKARVIFAFDEDLCVGASTVMPLLDADEEVRAAFERAGMSLASVDYFGESVVKKEYRGRGLGNRFFLEREAHARSLGLTVCAFCAVDRAKDHPLCPHDYVPNDAFWAKRGYAKAPGLTATFAWPDLGETVPSKKTMTFWTKNL